MIAKDEFTSMYRVLKLLRGQIRWLFLAAGAILLVAAPLAEGASRLALRLGALSLLFLAAFLAVFGGIGAGIAWLRNSRLAALVGEDPAPCVASDADGRIFYRNAAALARFGDTPTETMVRLLHERLASPATVLFRLQARAREEGAAREDVSSSLGTLRIVVYRLSTRCFLWRIDEFRPAEATEAIGVNLPILALGDNGEVLDCNAALLRLLGRRPRRIEQVLQNSHFVSGERVKVMAANGLTDAVAMEFDGVGEAPERRREILLMPAEAAEEDSPRPEFETLPMALMKFSASGHLTSANLAARELLGEDYMPGLCFHDLFEDLGRPVSHWLDDVISQRLPSGDEVLSLRRPGEAREADERFVHVSLSRIVENGKPAALAVLSDGTALKRLETQFIQSQKMQAVGQLAGGIAHDFNNLLTAISGHCDLLLTRHKPDDDDYADLSQIRQNANRAAALVSQLLAFSRKQALRAERLDLHDVLSDVTHLLNRLIGEKISLTLLRDSELGPVRADRRKLEQVLVNLVVNARDAMPEGGEITIETRAVHIEAPLVRGRVIVPAGHYSAIYVSDTGCGIPEEHQEKIFEPFFTTKRPGEGTGLGLSTVYGIVKQSGGYVFVESRIGKGTEFEVLLPVHRRSAQEGMRPEPAAVQNRPSEPMVRDGAGLIMLVEDEAPVRAFATRALQLSGFCVLEAENAEEALEKLKDPELQVDVLVTDVVMPGMDGPTLVRKAIEDRPDVRVVFISGYAEDYLIEGQSRIPNSVFLAKPFSLNELTATVQGQLG